MTILILDIGSVERNVRIVSFTLFLPFFSPSDFAVPAVVFVLRSLRARGKPCFVSVLVSRTEEVVADGPFSAGSDTDRVLAPAYYQTNEDIRKKE